MLSDRTLYAAAALDPPVLNHIAMNLQDLWNTAIVFCVLTYIDYIAMI